MGRFQSWNDPLGLGQQPEGLEHLLVAGRHVAGPASGGQMGVLGPDPRVVEPG
jgi:hypothetical protein